MYPTVVNTALTGSYSEIIYQQCRLPRFT